MLCFIINYASDLILIVSTFLPLNLVQFNALNLYRYCKEIHFPSHSLFIQIKILEGYKEDNELLRSTLEDLKKGQSEQSNRNVLEKQGWQNEKKQLQRDMKDIQAHAADSIDNLVAERNKLRKTLDDLTRQLGKGTRH